MADAHATHDHHDHPTGWRRYVYATNHKDIGTMYLIFAIVAGIIGAGMSIIFRIELSAPGDGILGGDYHMYNVLVTAHGLIMIFFMVMMLDLAPQFRSSVLFWNLKTTREPASFLIHKFGYPLLHGIFFLERLALTNGWYFALGVKWTHLHSLQEQCLSTSSYYIRKK